MANYFKTKEEFNQWISKRFEPKTAEEMLSMNITDDDIIQALIDDDYTDLNNLVLDGHAYQIGSYSNNGWIYEDEADKEYIERTGSKVELRKRDKNA